MFSYPSITPGGKYLSKDTPLVHVFDKIDGSNLRFEWTPKRGWYKFGTRNHLFDQSDKVFGPATNLFNEKYASDIECILRDNKVNNAVVFCEYYGENSFAGKHLVDDPKNLILFDANINKRGILGPEKFLQLFDSLEIANYLSTHVWDQEFMDAVYEESTPFTMTHEGVVGKSGCGTTHNLLLLKAKTKRWIDAVKARMSPEEAEKIIAS